VAEKLVVDSEEPNAYQFHPTLTQMKSKLFTAFVAMVVAFVAAPKSYAVTYSPAQFKAALTQAIGTKKGPAAYNAAAALFKKALTDKNNKKNASTYAAAIVTALKKPVTASQVGASRDALVKALVNGYFAGFAYNPQDPKFVAALQKLISTLPGSAKTDAVAASVASIVIAFNNSKGGGSTGINFLNQAIYGAFGLTPPNPVS
jgi:hypothetical protein